jgi:GNAT superfamily N-acetyltransferase
VWTPDRREVVASAYLGLQYTETNRHLAWFDISVGKEWRRQGIGRRLLAEIVAVGRDDSRTVLGSGTVQGHDAEKFLVAMGLEQKMVDRRSRLVLDKVDPALLDSWIADAAVRATDYELVFVDGAMPEDLLLPMVDLEHTMNDAPRDDLDMEDWVITPERWRESEKLEAETGGKRWTLIARHKATGELAGFTAIGWHPAIETVLWQYGTAVRPAHRGAGLGRWMKAAMIVKVNEEMPKVEFVDTWNAGSNKWMLDINIKLGYAPYLHYTDWQAPTDVLEKAVF